MIGIAPFAKHSCKQYSIENFLKIITDHQNKKPIVSIYGKNDYRFSASISHEKDYAIGIVIAKKN